MAFALPLLAGAVAGGGAAGLGASAATAIAIGSTVLTGVGAIQQAGMQGQIARNNYNIAMRNAIAESTAAQQKAIRSDREFAQLRGQQLAIQGASGLDVLGSTQLRTRNTTEATRTAQNLDIRSQGDAAVTQQFGAAQNAYLEGKQASNQAGLALAQMGLGLTKSVLGDTKLKKSLVGGSSSTRRKLYG